MTEGKNSESINLRISPVLKGALEKEAKANGLPVASYIKSLLTREMIGQGRLPKE